MLGADSRFASSLGGASRCFTERQDLTANNVGKVAKDDREMKEKRGRPQQWSCV
jgi:hypothetical protein